MGILVPITSLLTVVLNLRLERLDEPADDLIRVGALRQTDTLWQPEIRSEGQHSRVLSQCQAYGAFERGNVLEDEGAGSIIIGRPS